MKPTSSSTEIFFKKFLDNPSKIGAIAPSSIHLSRALLDFTDIKKHKVVVELGPGTGVFTKAILDEASENLKLICVEQDEAFAQHIRKTYPQVDVYTDSAENLKNCLEKSGINKVCLIISGIPFAAINQETQNNLLSSIKKSLGNGCEFLTFSYLHSPYTPAGRRFQKELVNHFGHFKKGKTIWRNLPPAFWYKCNNF